MTSHCNHGFEQGAIMAPDGTLKHDLIFKRVEARKGGGGGGGDKSSPGLAEFSNWVLPFF